MGFQIMFAFFEILVYNIGNLGKEKRYVYRRLKYGGLII